MSDDSVFQRLKRNCPYLLELDLSYNNLSTRDIEIISHILKKNTQLTVLNLEGNNLIDQDAILLSDMLKVNTTLKILNMENNSRIKDIGARALGEVITNRASPIELSLMRGFVITGCVHNTVYHMIKKG